MELRLPFPFGWRRKQKIHLHVWSPISTRIHSPFLLPFIPFPIKSVATLLCWAGKKEAVKWKGREAGSKSTSTTINQIKMLTTSCRNYKSLKLCVIEKSDGAMANNKLSYTTAKIVWSIKAGEMKRGKSFPVQMLECDCQSQTTWKGDFIYYYLDSFVSNLFCFAVLKFSRYTKRKLHGCGNSALAVSLSYSRPYK